MGFTLVQAQKALFLWAGVHHEAVAWLVQCLSIPDIAVPWNMTQLQVSVHVIPPLPTSPPIPLSAIRYNSVKRETRNTEQ